MRSLISVWVVCAAAMLAACGHTEDPDQARTARRKSPYFDMTGFLAQLEKNAKGHSFRKRALLGEEFEEGTSKAPDYHKELAIFYTADLTKPAWQGFFTTKETGPSTSYIATDSKPELRLLVVTKDDSGKVSRIDISLAQHNYLYDSEASGSLFVRYEGEKPLLDSVNLSGEQKIIMGTPFVYTLQGKSL